MDMLSGGYWLVIGRLSAGKWMAIGCVFISYWLTMDWLSAVYGPKSMHSRNRHILLGTKVDMAASNTWTVVCL